jgi:hypothetical protein
MRTHLGCTGRIKLGELSQDTQKRLEQVEGIWLEFSPDSMSLVVRHVQPDDTPALREIAGELVEFLSDVSEAEREKIPGGALYYLDEESGHYVRLKVSPGGIVTVAWAQPDYARATCEPYHGQKVVTVFDAYQRLNGTVKLHARPEFAEELRAAVEASGGLYPQGEFELRTVGSEIELSLCDLNCNVTVLLRLLQESAAPPDSLEGEIDVSSFRAGDIGDYCRFVFRAGDAWLLRPALWREAAETPPTSRESRAAA